MRRGQSKQSAEPDVQALLSFKALKDKQHPEALAIWARYQDSGNEGELNMGISKLLSSKAAAKPRAAAPLPPGGIDTFPDAGGAKLKELLAIGGNALSSSRNMAIDTSRDNEFRSAPHTPTRNVGVVGGGTARIDGMGSPLGASGAALSGPPSPSGAPPGLSVPQNAAGGPGGGSSSSLLGPGEDFPPQQNRQSPPQPPPQAGVQKVPPPPGMAAPPGIPQVKPADPSQGQMQLPNQQYQQVAAVPPQGHLNQTGAAADGGMQYGDGTQATYMYTTMDQASVGGTGGLQGVSQQQGGISLTGYPQSSPAPGYSNVGANISAMPSYGGMLGTTMPTYMVSNPQQNMQSAPMMTQMGMPAQYLQATPVVSVTDMGMYGQPMYIQQAPQMQQPQYQQQQHQQQQSNQMQYQQQQMQQMQQMQQQQQQQQPPQQQPPQQQPPQQMQQQPPPQQMQQQEGRPSAPSAGPDASPLTSAMDRLGLSQNPNPDARDASRDLFGSKDPRVGVDKYSDGPRVLGMPPSGGGMKTGGESFSASLGGQHTIGAQSLQHGRPGGPLPAGATYGRSSAGTEGTGSSRLPSGVPHGGLHDGNRDRAGADGGLRQGLYGQQGGALPRGGPLRGALGGPGASGAPGGRGSPLNGGLGGPSLGQMPGQNNLLNNGEPLAAEGAGGGAGIATPVPPKKPAGIYRITRNQNGVIDIAYQTRRNGPDVKLELEGTTLKPGTYMEVTWTLPVDEFNQSPADFVLGLVRYGAGSNSPGIVLKPLGGVDQRTAQRAVWRGTDIFGNEIYKGKVQFHAPKSAGVFVYRLFDNYSREKSMYTLGTSVAFVVELGDTDVTLNLRHALDSFLDAAYARGLTQLNSTIRGMRSPGKPMGRDQPQVLFQKCMWAVFDILEEGIGILDKARDKEREKDRERDKERAEAKAKGAAGAGAGAGAGGAGGAQDEVGRMFGEDPLNLLNKSDRADVSSGLRTGTDGPDAGPVSAEAEFKKRAEDREDEEFWNSAKSAQRLQTDLRDAVDNALTNRIAYSLLTEAQKTYAEGAAARYCRVMHRHFKSAEDMQTQQVESFGFLPTKAAAAVPPAAASGTAGDDIVSLGGPSDLTGVGTSGNAAVMNPAQQQGNNRKEHSKAQAKLTTAYKVVGSQVDALLPTLMPDQREFDRTRDEVRGRIERNVMQALDALPPTLGTGKITLPPATTLALFGSSRNTFGSASADLDMCLVLPPGKDIPSDEKPLVIEKLGDALKVAGMTQIQPRPTARIPIIQFVDPATEFECDISFNNPLAMTNTALLRAYSECDPRVRPLAFIIKTWAKARCMNCPGEGTLSSYGYILLLVHYLQTRTPAVVPNLQRLPPDWDGKYLQPSSANHVQPLPETFDMELNPADGSPCRTYYYQAPDDALRRKLEDYGRVNKQGVPELLVGFFRYYAYEFDFRSTVVSIQAGGPITKVGKAEVDGWPLHERLSIEDPFETSYDVAHVVKVSQMQHMHTEFLRAYCLIDRAGIRPLGSTGQAPGKAATAHSAADKLPSLPKMTDLLSVVLAPIEDGALPRFVEDARERQELYKAKLAAETAALSAAAGGGGARGPSPGTLLE